MRFISRIFDKVKYNLLQDLERRLQEINLEIKAKENVVKNQDIDIANKEQKIKKLLKKIEITEANINELENKEIELKEIEKKYSDIKDYGPEIPGSYGLYEPKYYMNNSSQYKQWLKELRDKQKKMISSKEAIETNTEWRVNDSKREGNKLINRVMKIAFRAFNGECDAIIATVKYYSKYEARRERIYRSYETVNEMIDIMNMRISQGYLVLKYEELDLVFGYELKLKEEREALSKLREIQRDEEIAKQEYEREINRIEKEQTHYRNELAKIREELKKTAEKEKQKYEKRIDELLKKVEQLEEEKINYKNLFENKAGYVYIISNIGAFGESVFKIGTTRRLDPYERIDELSNASVPFRFEPHALIFCENCYEVEREFHNYFGKNRINSINMYKEFFNIPIAVLEDYVISKYPTVQFARVAEAIEYNLSLSKKLETEKAN